MNNELKEEVTAKAVLSAIHSLLKLQVMDGKPMPILKVKEMMTLIESIRESKDIQGAIRNVALAMRRASEDVAKREAKKHADKVIE